MPEATLFRGNVAFEDGSDFLVVCVSRRNSKPPVDAMDVRIDGEHSGPSACEQEDAIGRLRADTANVEQVVADGCWRFSLHEVVEFCCTPVLVYDSFCGLDDDRRLLIVETCRLDCLRQFVVCCVGERNGEVLTPVPVYEARRGLVGSPRRSCSG